MVQISARIKEDAGCADSHRVRPEAASRRTEEDRWVPATLVPPEAFSDAVANWRDFQRLWDPGAGTGRHGAAVHRWVMTPATLSPTARGFSEGSGVCLQAQRRLGVGSESGRPARLQATELDTMLVPIPPL